MYYDTEYVLASEYQMRHWSREHFEESLEELFQDATGHPITLHNLTWRVLRETTPGLLEIAVSGDVEVLD